MTLKPTLSIPMIGARRWAVGLAAGVVLAVGLHGAGLSVARGGIALSDVYTEYGVRGRAAENAMLEAEGAARRFPVPVAEPEAVPTTGGWGEALWAGLAAAMGQAVAVAVWTVRPRRLAEPRRAHRRAVAGARGGLMWGWAALLMAVGGWDVYAHLVRPMYVRMALLGEPGVAAAVRADPLVSVLPLLGAALLIVGALAPWTGVRFGVRAGRWAWVGLASVAAGAAVLFVLGRTVWPGAGL